MTRASDDKPRPCWPAPQRPATGHDPQEGISAQGLIVTGASRHSISPGFQGLLAQAVQQVSATGADHALYVYGSVATGMARLGSSDVDLVTVGLSPAVAARIGQDLSTQYAHLCRGVDIGAAQAADHDGPGAQAYGNRVFLRHYCVHLAGPDVAQHLPAFPADRAAACGFNGDIGLCAARWRADAVGEPFPIGLGRRVARKTLLAVAGLVSVHDGVWTTDRVAAAWRWRMLRPELAEALGQLVAWSDPAAAAAPPSEVLRALDGVVAQVVEAFGQQIGFWP